MKSYLIFFLSVSLILSCSSKKDVLYIQDVNSYVDNFKYKDYLLKSDDYLKISVKSENPEAVSIFNPTSSNSNLTQNNRDALIWQGYKINNDGYINFPIIGKVKMSGKTLDQARDEIYDFIVNEKILVDPYIDVKLLNGSFTILGEVRSPGEYNFVQNNLNLFEAIGMAGDLTIDANRKDIRLIREYSNENKNIFEFDMTNSEFMSSDLFQIFPGDIIIVNQNKRKIISAGVINDPRNLTGLLSFLISVVLLINR